MPYPTEHAARMIEPSQFEEGSFRRKEISPGVVQILGKKPGESSMTVQAYRFSRELFSRAEAREWLKQHELEPIEFEAAEDRDEVSDKCKPKVEDLLVSEDRTDVPNNDEKTDSVNRIDYLDGPQAEYMTQNFQKTSDGFLVGKAPITNIGVFSYLNADGSTSRELRAPEHVFNEESLRSMAMVPLTNDHPALAFVTPENIKTLQVGNVGSDICRDEYHVSATITIQDPTAIDAVRSGKRALSAGYKCDTLPRAGVWMGVPYDAVQTNIRYNHVAIVDRGRAGDAARMRMDGWGVRADYETSVGSQNKSEEPMKKVKLDGVEYEAEAKVIETLTQTQTKVDGLTAELEKKNADFSELQGRHDSLADENKKLKEDMAELEKVAPAELEKAVQDRMELISAAQKAGVEKLDGSPDELRKAVILKAYPEAKLDGMDAAYIKGRFDSAVELLARNEKNVLDNAAAVAGQPAEDQTRVDAASAREKMIERAKNLYKGEN